MRRCAGIVLLALTVGLGMAGTASAQSGCGGLLQPPCPQPTPAPTPAPTPEPAPAPEPATPLSPARFAAIEPLHVDVAALDKGSASTAEIRRFRTHCRALSTRDPLLAAHRASCQAELAGFEAVNRGCSTPRGCARYAERTARLVTRALAAARRLNKAADAEIEDRRCRTAVRASAAELRKAEAVRGALREFAAAIRSGSQARIKRALARAERVDRRQVRTPAAQLKAFRADCR